MLLLASTPVVRTQVGVAAVGLLEVTALPPPSTATHSDDDGQEMLFSDLESILVRLHVAFVPSAGSLVLTTSPPLSTARHVVGEAMHDTPLSAPPASASRLVHVALAP